MTLDNMVSEMRAALGSGDETRGVPKWKVRAWMTRLEAAELLRKRVEPLVGWGDKREKGER